LYRIRHILLFIGVFICSFLNAQEKLDSLLQEIEVAKDDTSLIRLYNQVGSASFRTDQYLALSYWKKGLDLANKELEKGKHIKLLLKQKAGSLNGLGIIGRRSGDYSKAISYYQESLKLNQEIGDSSSTAYNLYNIGVIYRDLLEYDKALDYMNRSLEIRTITKDTTGLISGYNGIGIVYRRMKDYEKATDYYANALTLSGLIKSDEYLAESFNNIGVIKVMQDSLDEALYFFSKAFKLHVTSNNQSGIAKCYANIAHVYSAQKKYKLAIVEATKSLEISKAMGRKNEISKINLKLSSIFRKSKNFEQALRHYKKYIVYRDSVYSEKNMKEITQKEMQFEFDKKSMADSLARIDAERISEFAHQQEINEQKTFIYAGGFLLFVVIIFSLFVINRLKISNQQKEVIESQKVIVEEKNKEILDSITYAKRIQSAILPSLDLIKESLPNSFIFYQPKDIVAGDFYWYYKTENKILIAVADCTGHGVPGAMVSVVCNNALNRAVNEFKLEEPAQILDKTASLVIEAFAKTNKDVKDGMDISLCAFNKNDNTLTYAGAINSLFYVSESNFNEIKGDKQPIGQYAEVKPFTQHQLTLKKGDKIYLFTDGYPDQFGGEKGKKFMYKRFRSLIYETSGKEFSSQKNILENKFNNWKKGLEQLDDVCVIGIEI